MGKRVYREGLDGSLELVYDPYILANGTEDYESFVAHYGTITKSGRYPWGSGEDPYQRLRDYSAMNARLKKDLDGDMAAVARAMGFDTQNEYRKFTSIVSREKRDMDIDEATKLSKKGWSNVAIAEKLDLSPATVKNYLKPREDMVSTATQSAVEALKGQVDSRGYIDVSKGVESSMGISDTMKKNALYELKEKHGYEVHKIKERQANGNETWTLVLTPPGTEWKDVMANKHEVKPFVGKIDEYDKTASPTGIKPPVGIDPKRVEINWRETGGHLEDGVVYVRPGAKDLDMGTNQYAQVRIQVGDKHYIKGMAVLKDDLPKGVDLLVNVDKHRMDNKLDALKKLETIPSTGEVDLQNPFGSVIKRQDGALNIVNEAEDWDSWSKKLSSQFLSKQSLPLARTQLELTRTKKNEELEEILALTNPVVKKHMLETFADSADSASEHLKAVQLPGQRTHVLLPLTSIKPDEVYAPNYENGTSVVLIRYPHGGTFELPRLTVNNKSKQGDSLIGRNAVAAIGIHPDVATQLSGADFDGDTVMLVPDNQGRVKTQRAWRELTQFDTKLDYGPTPEQKAAIDAFEKTGEGKPPYKIMDKGATNAAMGSVSNLLSDMQLQGASKEEIIRATKHSMVVIDAAKHKLDYQRSAKENQIAQLKKKYQKGGASTLITQARADEPIPERKPAGYQDMPGGPINPETGELQYVNTGKLRKAKNKVTGEWEETDELLKVRVPRITTVKDAHELSSGTAMEDVYADHANHMKALGNKARRIMVNTEDPKVNDEAKKKYAAEVASLDESLRVAKANAPRERHAQRITQYVVQMKINENPDLDKDDIKKIRRQTLETARENTGAKKAQIVPTDREWEAIQAGAISATKLRDILRNGNTERIVELATPKSRTTVTTAQESRIRALKAAGRTNAEIAEALGISASTVSNYL